MPSERRFGFRIPLEMFVNQYAQDRPHRGLTVNISETGVYVNKVLAPMLRDARVVGLEFELPGTGEIVWARGEVCYDNLDDMFHGQGIRFAAMARAHQRLIRDYCIERRRARLAMLLERIRKSRIQ
ncbi:MAG TPA: PilZ domain-containing protein [Haliangiales bacterium]|nr:PilZ domain-containing protein [Haliangiales bacterium]